MFFDPFFLKKTLKLYSNSVLQNLFHCFYFWSIFVSKTVFARFAMAFNGFFSLFCQVTFGFWWVPISVLTEKKDTPTFVRSIAIEQVIKFFCVCKLDCKGFLNAFGLKNRKCCLRRGQWKRKEILRLLSKSK